MSVNDDWNPLSNHRFEVTFAIPSDLTVDTECECDACGHQCPIWGADPLNLSKDVLCIGDEIPAGVCPNCGKGMLYVTEG
jgi:hypothetical protein